MPISYGNVCGFKYDNIQPIYDPANKKKPLCETERKNGVYANPFDPPKPKRFKHGITAWRKHLCDCDICRSAYENHLRRDREGRAKEHFSSDGKLARCRFCGEFKPIDEFPYMYAGNNMKYVCSDCKGRR